MDRDFWVRSWQEGRIPFHQPQVNRHLIRFFPTVAPPSPATVLVPLCGKTLDLAWLRDRGDCATGVEIAKEPCHELVEELDLTADRETAHQFGAPGAFECWSGAGLTLLCGDFFDLKTDLPHGPGTFDCAWDRAALIALPPETRPKYAQLLLDSVRPGGVILLVTAEYDPAERQGPPFAVHSEEVHDLFGGTRIEELHLSKPPEQARVRLGVSSLLLRIQAIRKPGP